jgi:hypothetical protein
VLRIQKIVQFIASLSQVRSMDASSLWLAVGEQPAAGQRPWLADAANNKTPEAASA